jgi:putative membrane protein
MRWGYGPDWGMMGGWGGSGWIGPFMMLIIWLIILALAVAAVVWFVRSTSAHATTHLPHNVGRPRGLEVLEERYARGEINREEYLQKKSDIVG